MHISFVPKTYHLYLSATLISSKRQASSQSTPALSVPALVSLHPSLMVAQWFGKGTFGISALLRWCGDKKQRRGGGGWLPTMATGESSSISDVPPAACQPPNVIVQYVREIVSNIIWDRRQWLAPADCCRPTGLDNHTFANLPSHLLLQCPSP